MDNFPVIQGWSSYLFSSILLLVSMLQFVADEARRKNFAMAKQLRNNKKDFIGGYFVKGENGEIKTTDGDIQ